MNIGTMLPDWNMDMEQFLIVGMRTPLKNNYKYSLMLVLKSTELKTGPFLQSVLKSLVVHTKVVNISAKEHFRT